jgi:large subunit ribosomal protein L29
MKNKELKDLSAADLQENVNSEKASLQRLKFAHAISPIENPMKIRHARKQIARLKTELNSKSAKG